MPAIVLQARVRRILGHGTSGDKRARAREERGAQGPVRTLESRHHDLLLIVTSSPCIPTSMKTSACRGWTVTSGVQVQPRPSPETRSEARRGGNEGGR